MKILFCTNTFETGSNGPSNFVRILEEELILSEEIELHILSEDIKVETAFKHKLELSKFERLIFSPVGMLYRNFPYAKRIELLQAENQFDLIWHNNAITGLLSTRRISVPAIGMINDYISAETSWLNFQLTKRWFRQYLFSFFERISVEYYDLIVTNSSFLKVKLQEKYDFDPRFVKVLYKAAETKKHQLYAHEKLRIITNSLILKDHAIRVLFVKSDYETGGIYYLIKALSQLDYQFELTIVGPAINIITPYLASISGIHNVKFSPQGKSSHEDVLVLLKQVDIFCTPSKSEALGVANMEALLMAVPVVYTDVGGVREVMDNGNNGFACSSEDINSLVVGFESCITNDVLRHQKQQNGFQYVNTKFSIKSMIQNFYEISQYVLEKSKYR